MKVDFRLCNYFAIQNSKRKGKIFAKNPNANECSKKECCYIGFTSNSFKNASQVASIAPEYQGILNSVYKIGGLGNVTGEASVAFSENGGMDFRTFIPYYAPDNISGGIKVKTPLIENGKRVEWEVPNMAGDTVVKKDGAPLVEKIPAYTFKSMPIDYTLQEGENFVIHEPVNKDMPWKTAYKILEDTGIKGSVESISDNLENAERIPYKVFEIKGRNLGDIENPPVYIVYTPELAKFPEAYKANPYLKNVTFEDANYGVFSRATIDAMPKLNDEKFGNFNPANFWMHDRQTFSSIVDMSEKSSKGDGYWSGIKVHSSYHNPGRSYQGHYKNPVDFMRVVGTHEDLNELQKNEDNYAFAKDMVKKINEKRAEKGGKLSSSDVLTKEEMQRLNAIFKPLYGDFVDETGEYNLCKIPVESIRKNPYNFSAGTVSSNFGKEMKNHNTLEIAPGLTKDFASIPLINIVNGSSAKSMGLDVIGEFGKNNEFTKSAKFGYTPLTGEIISSPDLLFQTKQNNKKWFIDTIAQAAKKGQDALNSLFFSKDAIDKGAGVLGGLSEYKEGDTLFIGWGRPVSQKGFTTTLEGVLDYFKNKDIPFETKSGAKFLIGAGPWVNDAADWITIQKQMQEIALLDGGKYKDNVCYLNGFFTNRIVACADFSCITSRYEPCGITPLESFAGGTPVISVNTGGSPDFVFPYKQGKTVTNETGFLTKNAYLVNPRNIGINYGISKTALDDARRIASGKEVSECISEAVDLLHNSPDEYKKMMTNAINSKIDWHNNSVFNGGLSAIERYKENVWSIGKNNEIITGEERNMLPFVSLKGQAQQNPIKETFEQVLKETNTPDTSVQNIVFKGKQKNILNTIAAHKGIAAFVAIAGICTGVYAYAINKKFSNVNKNKSQEPKNNNRFGALA